MANKKEDKKDPRYNWIHIPENYFDRVMTKIIRKTENGNTKIVLYFKMLDAVKNTDGYYMFQRATQSISEEIAIQINEDAELVKATLDTLSNLELVEIEEDGCYFDEVNQFVGSLAESTLRVQEYRAREKAKKAREAKQKNNMMKQDNITKETNSNNAKQDDITNETECNNSMLQGKQTKVTSETECNIEKEREEDKEIDKYINNNCAKSSYPEAQEVIDMYNNTCTSLTLSPNIEVIGEQWDGKYKGLYEAINKCIPLTNPTITTNEFKTTFETAEGMSEQIKKSSKEDGCTNELEFILNRMLKTKEKVTA